MSDREQSRRLTLAERTAANEDVLANPALCLAVRDNLINAAYLSVRGDVTRATGLQLIAICRASCIANETPEAEPILRMLLAHERGLELRDLAADALKSLRSSQSFVYTIGADRVAMECLIRWVERSSWRAYPEPVALPDKAQLGLLMKSKNPAVRVFGIAAMGLLGGDEA